MVEVMGLVGGVYGWITLVLCRGCCTDWPVFIVTGLGSCFVK